MYNQHNLAAVSDMKMSDLIHVNPHFILMLEHFGIDLEVHEKTIKQICIERNINVALFITFTELFSGIETGEIKENSWDDIQIIVKYLKNCHHYYLEDSYPKIMNYIQQIHLINHCSETEMVEKFFVEYFNEVKVHLDYENRVVFPYVIHLYEQVKNIKTGVSQSDFSVTNYKEHHEDIEEKLNDLKQLLIKYLPINNDQQIRRNLLFSLFEQEYDLHIHSLIEDTILIPLVEKMEKTLSHQS